MKVVVTSRALEVALVNQYDPGIKITAQTADGGAFVTLSINHLKSASISCKKDEFVQWAQRAIEELSS